MSNTHKSESRSNPADFSEREKDIPGDRYGPDEVAREQKAQRLKMAIPLILICIAVVTYFLFIREGSNVIKEEIRTRLDQAVPPDITVPAIPVAKAPLPPPVIAAPVPPIELVPAPTAVIAPPPVRDRNANRMAATPSSLAARMSGGTGIGTKNPDQLKLTQLIGAAASVISRPTHTITRGTPFGDCFSTVKIITEVPGQITCVLASNVYGADKKMVLLPKGTKIVGEQIGQLAIGQERMLAMAARAETPDHVIVDLGSSFSDQLGQSGISGDVDSRFVKRLVPALMFSVLDSLTLNLNNKGSGGGGGNAIIVGAGGTTRDTAKGVLEQYKNIPPVITANRICGSVMTAKARARDAPRLRATISWFMS